MIKIDTRGELCPTPLIMTKRAITAAVPGEEIEVMSDNDTAKCNLLDYIAELGYSAICTVSGGEYIIRFTIEKGLQGGDSAKPSAEPELLCPVSAGASAVVGYGPSSGAVAAVAPRRNGYAVVIKSEYMGEGDRELGALLMRACINSLAEVDSLPGTIILYNSGVMLAVAGTDTAAALQKLGQLGVDIVVCGTCVDFYDIKETLAVGMVSNMYKINTLLSQAGHVVYP